MRRFSASNLHRTTDNVKDICHHTFHPSVMPKPTKGKIHDIRHGNEM